MASASRTRIRNRRGQGEQLREELVAAADAILDRAGDPARVTVRGVAGAVGVAPNAVYLHFADRDALLAEVATRAFDALTAAIEAAIDGIEDPLERLRAGHVEYCRRAIARPGHYRAMFGGTLAATDTAGIDAAGVDGGTAPPTAAGPGPASSGDRLLGASLAAYQTLLDACRACAAAGVVGDRDPDRLAGAVWALEHGWSDLAIRGLGAMLPDPVEALDALLGT